MSNKVSAQIRADFQNDLERIQRKIFKDRPDSGEAYIKENYGMLQVMYWNGFEKGMKHAAKKFEKIGSLDNLKRK